MTLINNYDSTPIADSADIHLRSRLGIETPLDSDIGASYEGNQSFQAGTEQHQLAFHNSCPASPSDPPRRNRRIPSSQPSASSTTVLQ